MFVCAGAERLMGFHGNVLCMIVSSCDMVDILL